MDEEFNCFAWSERDEQMWKEWQEMNGAWPYATPRDECVAVNGDFVGAGENSRTIVQIENGAVVNVFYLRDEEDVPNTLRFLAGEGNYSVCMDEDGIIIDVSEEIDRGSVWIVVAVLVLIVVMVLSLGISKGASKQPVEDTLPYAPTTEVK